MKVSKVAKLVLVIIMSFTMLFCTGKVFAANDNITDITGTLTGNSTSGNTTTGNSTTGNTATGNNTTANKVLTTNNTNSANNTSNYNNTALPKTGIEGTASATVFVVVLAISAVYAYKKVQYYKNI